MKILIIGNGGREHALAWKISQSTKCSQIFVAPGNAGTQLDKNLTNINLTHLDAWLAFALKEQIDLTIVGPEAPLAEGVVDAFQAAGLKIFGPTKAATQLESSKIFAKHFMRRHHIPTATFAEFDNKIAAHEYVNQQNAPIVIKADKLAGGKGVIVAQNINDAHEAIENLLEPDSSILIEEFIEGEEASFIVLSDGKNILPLATSKDHKRLLDEDKGPNTGGMGAYSPAAIVTPEVHARIMREIINPTISGMDKENIPFTGFLYAGVMIDKKGNPKTLEFNCRLGDPETQPLLVRLKSDLLELIESAIDKTLHQAETVWDRRPAVGVVLASKGYPNQPETGFQITQLPDLEEGVQIFHAGTTCQNGQILTSGGRVLCVTAIGDTLKLARQRAYEVAEKISFSGKQMRHDIALKSNSNKIS
ncbi:MAG: phosphoribosylamine--glycine ligase [Proteobacteria bacterium]|nr:phosphoribosylamine--glycine ligase [Pseudomonadota bacterium]MDE3208282.1 phosphoribosylamine--glycine ligase [Pseudomonadota bacterium]